MRDTTWWKWVKWSGTASFVISTTIMLSPIAASTAITPWLVYIYGNLVWLIDSHLWKNRPWVAISTFFIIMDVFIIIGRVSGVDVFASISPLIQLLEALP